MEVEFHSFLNSAHNGSNGAITPNSQDAASTALSFEILENKKLRIWSGLKWNAVQLFVRRDCELTERVQQRCRPLYGEQSRDQKKSIQIVNVHYTGEFADSMRGGHLYKINQYPISDPVLKHEPSTTPQAFFSCTLNRAYMT